VENRHEYFGIPMILPNVSLREWNSWQVGGTAEFFCQPEDITQVREALQFAQAQGKKITVLGHGSNVLISDSGIKGLVLSTRKLNRMFSEVKNERLIIEAESGVPKSEILKVFLKYQLPPALFLAGIPGNVGGGVVMNAGVSENFVPREFVEITDWIEVIRFDGKVDRIEAQNLKWSYRHCEGWQPGIILKVGLSWDHQPKSSINVQVREANQLRLSKQPLDMPSCGSVFINPKNAKAAQLIDSCGLKGYTIGGAQVSMKHANFIVNLGHATAKEMNEVITHVQKTVLEKTGISLRTEVIRLGEWT